MTGFSDADFDDGCVMDELQTRSFFPYNGEDGDLFRKHGVAGWRVSVYGTYLVRIQKKTGRRKGRNHWTTTEQWEVDPEDDLPREQIQDFAAALDSLIEHGDLDQWGESPATA